MQRSEPYASAGWHDREQQYSDRRDTRHPFPESSLRPLTQHNYRQVMRNNFHVSNDFDLSGDFPDTDINTTLNILMVEIHGGAEIEREDVIRLYDQATQEPPGSWVVAASQLRILQDRS